MKRTKRQRKAPKANPVLAELKKLRDDELENVTGGNEGPRNCGGALEMCCD